MSNNELERELRFNITLAFEALKDRDCLKSKESAIKISEIIIAANCLSIEIVNRYKHNQFQIGNE